MKCCDKIKRREIERKYKWNNYISMIWIHFEWEKCEDYRMIEIELNIYINEMKLIILNNLYILYKFFKL